MKIAYLLHSKSQM